MKTQEKLQGEALTEAREKFVLALQGKDPSISRGEAMKAAKKAIPGARGGARFKKVPTGKRVAEPKVSTTGLEAVNFNDFLELPKEVLELIKEHVPVMARNRVVHLDIDLAAGRISGELAPAKFSMDLALAKKE